MSSFDSAMETAIQQPFIRIFTAVQVCFSDYTLNIMDGSGFVSFLGKSFTSSDSISGTISEISTISSAFATQSPSVDITMMPPAVGGTVNLNNPLYQGSPVNIWLGVMNESTGQPYGVPYQMFVGSLDYAQSDFDQNTQTVKLHIVSAFDRLFAGDEAARLNQQFHQMIYPTETGFSLNNSATVPPFWGMVATSNPEFPSLPIAASLADRLSGQSTGGTTTGLTYGI